MKRFHVRTLFFVLLGMLLLTNFIFVLGVDCVKDRVPDDIICPNVSPPEDCDSGEMRYELFPDIVYLYDPFGVPVDVFVDDFIVSTSASCGGRIAIANDGAFGITRNDGSYAIMDGIGECGTEYNCDWDSVGYIGGYTWEHHSGLYGDYYAAIYSYRPQFQCKIDEENPCSGPLPGDLWGAANVFDCIEE